MGFIKAGKLAWPDTRARRSPGDAGKSVSSQSPPEAAPTAGGIVSSCAGQRPRSRADDGAAGTAPAEGGARDERLVGSTSGGHDTPDLVFAELLAAADTSDPGSALRKILDKYAEAAFYGDLCSKIKALRFLREDEVRALLRIDEHTRRD